MGRVFTIILVVIGIIIFCNNILPMILAGGMAAAGARVSAL